MNLLAETLRDIAKSGHTPDDIVFIGSRKSGHHCSWDEFTHLADIEYDGGYGAQEVASDLEIVFRDGGGMWRTEYDGSEGWEYHRPFVMPQDAKPIKRLTVEGTDAIGWCELGELQEAEEEAHA